jgi:hypothetical protein
MAHVSQCLRISERAIAVQTLILCLTRPFLHQKVVLQRGLRRQPKFQISNSRSYCGNDSCDGKSLRAAKQFTLCSTRIFRDGARKNWPLRGSPRHALPRNQPCRIENPRPRRGNGALEVSALQLLSGRRSIIGWPSGTAIDSQDTMLFRALAGVRSMNEVFPLERAAEAYARMMSGQARFRVVLTTGAWHWARGATLGYCPAVVVPVRRLPRCWSTSTVTTPARKAVRYFD